MCNKVKITNESIDQQLHDQERTITRISDVVNSHTPLTWKCLVCKYTWNAAPSDVLNKGTDCRKCAGLLKRTNAEIDTLLNPKNILRLEPFQNANTKHLWKCITCEHVWNATLSDILKSINNCDNTGCPKCGRKSGGRKRSLLKLEEITNTLTAKGLILLSTFTQERDKHEILCTICNYKSYRTLRSILSGSNCPSCLGSMPLTNESIDKKLLTLNDQILRIGDFIEPDIKIEWACTICDNHWFARPSGILWQKRGCPRCRTLGIVSKLYFNKNPEKRLSNGFLYLVEGYDSDIHFLKVGITQKSAAQRFKDTSKKFKIKEIGSKAMLLGAAFDLEQNTMRKFIKLAYQPNGLAGKTECFKYSQDIIDYFNSL